MGCFENIRPNVYCYVLHCPVVNECRKGHKKGYYNEWKKRFIYDVIYVEKVN